MKEAQRCPRKRKVTFRENFFYFTTTCRLAKKRTKTEAEATCACRNRRFRPFVTAARVPSSLCFTVAAAGRAAVTRRAGRRPHRPQHLPRARLHHRLHGQTRRAPVPRQVVTSCFGVRVSVARSCYLFPPLALAAVLHPANVCINGLLK